MVWVVLINLISSALLASIQSQRSSPDRQERVVMGRPEESRLRVGGAVEAGGASGDGMVHVGGGIIISPAEVGWGGRDATPAEVGDGVDVGEVEAEEITQWATSVTDDQAVVPVVVVHERVWCQPGESLGEDGSLFPVSGGNK